MRVRGTMTWRAVMLSSSSALSSISSCAEESWPEVRAALTIRRSSSGEWTEPWRISVVPKERRTKPAARLMNDGERGGDGEKDIHGRGDRQGDAFGALESQGLGYEFAEGYVQAGDEHEGDADGDGVRIEDGVGDAANPAFEEARQNGFAQPAEGEAGDGDPSCTPFTTRVSCW